MRVAVVTRFVHSVGGVETYLECVLPELAARGHEVKVWYEVNVLSGRPIVPPGIGAVRAGGSETERERALVDIRTWRPDVIFSQGITDVSLERQMQEVAPFVPLLHTYEGTCISGTKMHSLPSMQPCTRALGPACLALYHVRRCGGLSPVTMFRSYASQRVRQEVLRASDAVATLSDHMRRDCITQGISPDAVWQLPPFVPTAQGPVEPRRASLTSRAHLIFLGRMERMKGAGLLVDALAKVASPVAQLLQVTMIGDGREKNQCERRASSLKTAGLDIHFPGWLSPDRCAEMLRSADLLVFPSIWPEPLGLAGFEAAAAGVPALAFDVGGIREWLDDEVTGRLLTEPPSAAALARGIEDCVSDRARLARWGVAAAHSVSSRTMTGHVDALEALFRRVVAAKTNRVAREAVDA